MRGIAITVAAPAVIFHSVIRSPSLHPDSLAVAFVRTVMLNHWYHHRGQLLVYLRLLDLPVPSVYGPTADENPFAA